MYGPYPALVTDWHDGDTCHLELDLGFAVYLVSHDLAGRPILACRIYGLNAPELSTEAGKLALAFAELICPPGTRLTVLSHGWDKYGGRFDGSLKLPDGTDFAARMIAAGQGVPYLP